MQITDTECNYVTGTINRRHIAEGKSIMRPINVSKYQKMLNLYDFRRLLLALMSSMERSHIYQCLKVNEISDLSEQEEARVHG